MKLLVFTQKVDLNDPVLGFFHTWISTLAQSYDTVSVICLQKGEFELPKNVTVYSLGKESKTSRLLYVKNFFKYVFALAGSYDKVFVHMNEEYVLLGGLYWKFNGIPVYLWRNHPKGGIATKVAVLLSTKVFCTSRQAFTARFKKTVVMPVGTDEETYHPADSVTRKKYSVCMVSRIDPIKHIELALEAMHLLVTSGTQISLVVVGAPSPKYTEYFEDLKKYVSSHSLTQAVSFLGALPPYKTPEVYQNHEVYLNLTESGSFDKTIVEAAACGAIPLVSNTSLAGLLPDVCITDSLPEKVAEAIKRLFEPRTQTELKQKLSEFAASQSLSALLKKLSQEML